MYRWIMVPSPMISKLSSTAFTESPVQGTIDLYLLNDFLDMNIVLLALKSIKVGTFPFWNSWNPLLISAVAPASLINTPDSLVVFGICTESTKCSFELVEPAEVVVVAAVVFAQFLWPKFGGNCPSLPPPGQ